MPNITISYLLDIQTQLKVLKVQLLNVKSVVDQHMTAAHRQMCEIKDILHKLQVRLGTTNNNNLPANTNTDKKQARALELQFKAPHRRDLSR